MQRTCVLIKPDALQRNLLGEIIRRFEQKGLKIVGLKMVQLSDLKLDEHYAHHRDKPFFAGLKHFMRSAPIIAMVLEGLDAIDTVRTIVGPTKGRTAPAGTIRGDLAMSTQANLIHASDSTAAAEQEVRRFFNADELFTYEKMDAAWVYGDDERG
ncbi:nucleoside-diphosphate kinase [Candidatus Uhrbacteria bacterium]|nr:nucleoside-diphosphate kinase [Candidatus Uhrbacteria bacterium]